MTLEELNKLIQSAEKEHGSAAPSYEVQKPLDPDLLEIEAWIGDFTPEQKRELKTELLSAYVTKESIFKPGSWWKQPGFKYLAIAASVSILLVVGLIIFKRPMETPEIVQNPKSNSTNTVEVPQPTASAVLDYKILLRRNFGLLKPKSQLANEERDAEDHRLGLVLVRSVLKLANQTLLQRKADSDRENPSRSQSIDGLLEELNSKNLQDSIAFIKALVPDAVAIVPEFQAIQNENGLGKFRKVPEIKLTGVHESDLKSLGAPVSIKLFRKLNRELNGIPGPLPETYINKLRNEGLSTQDQAETFRNLTAIDKDSLMLIELKNLNKEEIMLLWERLENIKGNSAAEPYRQILLYFICGRYKEVLSEKCTNL